MMKFFLSVIFIFSSTMLLAQNENFEVSIVQDSVLQKANEKSIVKLKKKPFKIVLKLTNLEGVYVYANFKNNIYNTPSNESIKNFKEIPAMTMAEEEFNPSQELMINDEGWCYWFYNTTDKWHRMDKEVLVTKESTTVSKTIKQFYMVASEENIALEDNVKKLYLFFVAGKKDDSYLLTSEIKRFKIEVNWE